MKTTTRTTGIVTTLLLAAVFAGCQVSYTFGGAQEAIVDPCSGDEIGVYDPLTDTLYFDSGEELSRLDIAGTLGGPEDLDGLSRCQVAPEAGDELRWEYLDQAALETFVCAGTCDADGCREVCTAALVSAGEACVGGDGDDRGEDDCGCGGDDPGFEYEREHPQPEADTTCAGGACASPRVREI